VTCTSRHFFFESLTGDMERSQRETWSETAPDMHPYGVGGRATRDGRDAALYAPTNVNEDHFRLDETRAPYRRYSKRESLKLREASGSTGIEEHTAGSVYGIGDAPTGTKGRTLYRPLELQSGCVQSVDLQEPSSFPASVPRPPETVVTRADTLSPPWYAFRKMHPQHGPFRLPDAPVTLHVAGLMLIWVLVLVSLRNRSKYGVQRIDRGARIWRERTRARARHHGSPASAASLAQHVHPCCWLLLPLPRVIRVHSASVWPTVKPITTTKLENPDHLERLWYQRHSRHYANLHDLSLGGTFIALSDSDVDSEDSAIPTIEEYAAHRSELPASELMQHRSANVHTIENLAFPTVSGQIEKNQAPFRARLESKPQIQVLRERNQDVPERQSKSGRRNGPMGKRASLPASWDGSIQYSLPMPGADARAPIFDNASSISPSAIDSSLEAANTEKGDRVWEHHASAGDISSSWLLPSRHSVGDCFEASEPSLEFETSEHARHPERFITAMTAFSARAGPVSESGQISTSAALSDQSGTATECTPMAPNSFATGPKQGLPVLSALIWQDARVRRNADGNWWLERHGEYRLEHQPHVLIHFGDKFGVDARILPHSQESQVWYEWYIERRPANSSVEQPSYQGCRWGRNNAGDTWYVRYGTDASGYHWEQRLDSNGARFQQEWEQSIATVLHVCDYDCDRFVSSFAVGMHSI